MVDIFNNKRKYDIDDQLRPICESYLSDKVNYKVLCEDEKMKMADNVVTKLFGDIKRKAYKCDLGDVDRTKGDIKALKNYKALVRALNFLEQTANQQVSNDIGHRVDVLKEAHGVLLSHRDVFKSAYSMGNDFMIVTYCSAAVALVTGVSETIAMATEYINSEARRDVRKTRKTYQVKSKHIEALEDINRMAKDGKLREISGKLLVKKEAGIGGVVLYTQAFIAAVIILLKSLKFIVYTYYHSRIKVADHLRNIAEYVEMKSDRTMDKSIKAKQMKWIENLKKFAEKVDIDSVKSNVEATNEVNKSEASYADMPTDWIL